MGLGNRIKYSATTQQTASIHSLDLYLSPKIVILLQWEKPRANICVSYMNNRIFWVGRNSKESSQFRSWPCKGQPQGSHHIPENIVQMLLKSGRLGAVTTLLGSLFQSSTERTSCCSLRSWGILVTRQEKSAPLLPLMRKL